MSGMARWIIDVEKEVGGEHWTNVYNVLTSDLVSARAAADRIVTREKLVHTNAVNFTVYRVRPAIAPSGGGTVVAIGGTGSLNDPSPRLPLFCVVRVDFRTLAGRPSRKYLRCALSVANVAAHGLWVSSIVSTINSQYSAPMAADLDFVDVDGQPFTGAVTFSAIYMRQLRRGSRKRTTPVLPAS